VTSPARAGHTRVVSSDDEPLILVDAADRELGTLAKSACHDGGGLLHRAFSLFVFNDEGELLIQQRHPTKRLWPSYWSNSCCSHPRAGEDLTEAVSRRLAQELALECELSFVYKFEYLARYGTAGTEHELCSVYVGRTSEEPSANETEIAAWRWIAPDALDRELAQDGERFTPWFRMEWEKLRREHRGALAAVGVSS
jgi:isopentenyl-diphosphate delta-isomerase